MILFNRQDGIVTIEMNERDAREMAEVLKSCTLQDANLGHLSIMKDLPELLLEKESKNSEEDALANPWYFVDTRTGDAMVINWARNAPTGEDWVKVSESFWNLHCK